MPAVERRSWIRTGYMNGLDSTSVCGWMCHQKPFGTYISNIYGYYKAFNIIMDAMGHLLQSDGQQTPAAAAHIAGLNNHSAV